MHFSTNQDPKLSLAQGSWWCRAATDHPSLSYVLIPLKGRAGDIDAYAIFLSADPDPSIFDVLLAKLYDIASAQAGIEQKSHGEPLLRP